jgi:hypothetical protein
MLDTSTGQNKRLAVGAPSELVPGCTFYWVYTKFSESVYILGRAGSTVRWMLVVPWAPVGHPTGPVVELVALPGTRLPLGNTAFAFLLDVCAQDQPALPFLFLAMSDHHLWLFAGVHVAAASTVHSNRRDRIDSMSKQLSTRLFFSLGELAFPVFLLLAAFGLG